MHKRRTREPLQLEGGGPPIPADRPPMSPALRPGRGALEGKGPQKRPQRRLGRRLEEAAKAVGCGYCRLQMPLKLALGVRGAAAGHRLGALEGAPLMGLSGLGPPSSKTPHAIIKPYMHSAPLCDIPSGCCSFTGPWTVTRSSLRMLRRIAAFCRPLRPVLLLVSCPRSRSPVVGVPGLC